MTKEEKCNDDFKQQPSFIREHQLPFTEGWMAGYEKAQSEFKNLGIADVSHSMTGEGMNCLEFFDMIKKEWCISEEQCKPFWNDVLTFARKYHKEFQGWIKADELPEFDGWYLVHIVKKEQCGSYTKRLEVVYFGYAKWSIKENERLTHWMIVLPPDRTVTLL